MKCGKLLNTRRGEASAIHGKQRDEAFKAEDFALVVRFCFIGLGLSYVAILGAPDVVLVIARAFAAFCGVSPAT